MSEETRGGTPDLSRIVNLIMENPRLIEEISALAKGDGEIKSPDADEKTELPSPTVAEATYGVGTPSRERRTELLSALKPYLSSERQRAIDSMISIADILDTVRRK